MSVILNNLLKPLASYFADERITDISINKPGEIWIDDGKKSLCVPIPVLDFNKCKALAQQIATASEQIVNEQQPILSAYLPKGERVQIVLSPATLWIDTSTAPKQTIALSIRKLHTANLELSNYANNGGFAFVNTSIKETQEHNDKILSLYENKEHEKLLSYAVHNKQNILISGATYSGKTSFLNMLLKEIPLEERLITIEDVPELDVPHPNRVRLFYSRGGQGRATVQASDLVLSTLRMRPDRIILGELRGDDAIHWLAAANSGHPGTIATIHADEPKMALEKLALMVIATQPSLRHEEVHRYIRSIIKLIVQLKRKQNGKRYVSEIFINKEIIL